MNFKASRRATNMLSQLYCRRHTAAANTSSNTLIHKERKPVSERLPMVSSVTMDTNKLHLSQFQSVIYCSGWANDDFVKVQNNFNLNFFQLTQPYDFCNAWVTNSGLEKEVGDFEKGKEYDLVISNVNKKLGWVFIIFLLLCGYALWNVKLCAGELFDNLRLKKKSRLVKLQRNVSNKVKRTKHVATMSFRAGLWSDKARSMVLGFLNRWHCRHGVWRGFGLLLWGGLWLWYEQKHSLRRNAEHAEVLAVQWCQWTASKNLNYTFYNDATSSRCTWPIRRHHSVEKLKLCPTDLQKVENESTVWIRIKLSRHSLRVSFRWLITFNVDF